MSDVERDQKFTDYLHTAQNCIEEKDYEGFVSAIAVAKFLATFEEATEVLYWYVEGLYRFGRYDLALQAIEKNLVLQAGGTKSVEILLIKGVSEAKLNKLDRAFETLEQLRSHDDLTIRVKAQINLSWLYLHKYEMERDPDYLQLIVTMCQETQQHFAELLEVNLCKKILVWLGIAYFYQGNYELALDCYLQADRYVTDDPNVLNNIASLYIKMGEIDKSRANLEKAENESTRSKNYSELAYAYKTRAELMEYIGDLSQAREYYLLAQDQFAEVNQMQQVFKCVRNIIRLDATINRESMAVIGAKSSTNTLESFGEEIHTTMKGMVTT